MVIITNQEELEAQLQKALDDRLGQAINSLIREIVVTELPKGEASSIAGELIAKRIAPGEWGVYASQTWVWLNDGTGIYNPEHAGRGPGGAIVPYNAKALAFRNQELAMVLGFPSEMVFLKSVKGIQPRWYWDRYFTKVRITEGIAKAKA